MDGTDSGQFWRGNLAASPGRREADYQQNGSKTPAERVQETATLAVRPPGQEGLSPYEVRILAILGNPNSTIESNREIAIALGTTPGAIKQHLHRMYERYGVRSIRGLFRLLWRAPKD